MLICKKCGETFDEAHHGNVRSPDFDGHAYDPVCPRCGSTDIDDAAICDVCKKYYPASDTVFGGKHRLCPDCAREAERDLLAYIDRQAEPVKAYLRELTEGWIDDE